MADQDKTIEKKLEGSELGGIESVSELGVDKDKEGLKKEDSLEKISSSENDQEKKKEVMEAIQQKGGSGNDDDDDSSDDDYREIKNHAKDIAETKDIEQQIDKLVKLAIQKDPYTAIKVARHLDENYVLDQVHDKLVEDETRKALIEKGLLKEF